MKLTVDDGICLLTPTTAEETAGIRALSRTKIGARLKYLGRGPDFAEGFFTIRLKAGKTELLVSGDEQEDHYRVNNLRNLCFFTSGLIYMGRQGDSIKVSGGTCKVCDVQIVDYSSVEWKVCRACASKCEHALGEPGLVHSRKGLDAKCYCKKCGRVPRSIVDQIGELEEAK